MTVAESGMDVALRLRDRQVIDVNGLMVCKVDDVEISAKGRRLQITGLLSGPPALLPRFAGRLGDSLLEQWRRLAPEQAGRAVPWRVDLRHIDRIDSAVHLSVERAELLIKPDAQHAPGTHHLNDLVGSRVLFDGERVGHVLDVRLASWTSTTHVDCTCLIVGRGRPGAMLGYDRSPHMGPAMVGHAIRWLHRHTVLVDLSDVTRLDWDEREIEISRGVRELAPISSQ